MVRAINYGPRELSLIVKYRADMQIMLKITLLITSDLSFNSLAFRQMHQLTYFLKRTSAAICVCVCVCVCVSETPVAQGFVISTFGFKRYLFTGHVNSSHR